MEEMIIEKLKSYYSIGSILIDLDLSHWGGYPRSSLRPNHEIWVVIDSVICSADLTLCLTSKYLYIRECKKYFQTLTEGMIIRG